MADTVYIYSQSISNRLAYTCNLLLKTVLNVDFKLIDNIDDYPTGQALINYSDQTIAGSISIKPHQLLFEQDIRPQNIEVSTLNGIPCFFKTGDAATINYDIFASSFYIATRYEEYLPFEPDNHGRFSAGQSLAYQNGFLHLPIVHLWADTLKKALQTSFPELIFPKSVFKQINTIDIDVAYAFKGKPLLRQAGNLIKSLLRRDTVTLKNHRDYRKRNKDYLDTYDYIEQIAKQYPLPHIFFCEVGSYAKYDRNIPLNKVYKSLIKRLSKTGKIGIHPSYQSNDKPHQLPQLINKLQSTIETPVTKSRQHFLRLNFPDTYERLIANGITEDYSMGFQDAIGFRAGLCVPFSFFNVTTNESRPLTIIPFQVMDGTLKDYMALGIDDSIVETLKIKQQVQKTGGLFISIFHNSSLTNQGEWQGWRKLYEAIRT
ncbi:MAG: hypothetical protein CSA40_01045 [Flavobacteriales bacterium]|nr:MAG: hypothetical protein CSA40_01045 [Flavobacteriales bacterium]